MAISTHTPQKRLTPQERRALLDGSNVLIDSLFDEYGRVEAWKPETILSTRLGKHLPSQYGAHYTPLFFKQFGICVVSMAWKFAQPKPALPSSLAEQLAAWAIVQEAKELLQQEGEPNGEQESPQDFQDFIHEYFPDTAFLLLFDHVSDGNEVSAT